MYKEPATWPVFLRLVLGGPGKPSDDSHKFPIKQNVSYREIKHKLSGRTLYA